MFLQCFIEHRCDKMLSSLRDGAVAARKAHNLEVGGSNPPPATYRICKNYTKGIDMGLFGLKISGNKVTVKRPAPQSPANVRHVTPKQGHNPAHTHVNVPKSIAKKVTSK